MARHAHKASGWADALLPWLIQVGIGPAVVAVPVNWAADALAGAAQRWFQRLLRKDDLSRVVRAAAGTSVDLNHGEFNAVRRLLEDKQTWSLLGQGTVEDLAARIATSLPARDGRTTDDSQRAALAIARGLLEFAVADLEPKLFQQVILARLQRMETGQASALDEALLGMQADLVVRLEAQGGIETERFTTLMGHLKRVLDRLPPGPAGRGEIMIYLKTLVEWLSTDPWPHRFDQPALKPATIERKLRVTATGPPRGEYLDADDLAQHCHRLVILGGPGSGKTWLAKRTARICAGDALDALTSGWGLDETELPLYTTCSRLLSTDGDIRQAVVSSALDQLGDVGGSRIRTALGMFFTERNAPTVLVIDSLDEAHGHDERLRQADTLPWRIVLTSRSSSWNHQLDIKENNHFHRVGELQPLRYPDDVEPFVRHWFASRPERGEDLVAQISRRPGLRQPATAPLILAFYCILGGDQTLPEFRHEIYSKVLNRMFTGTWRGSGDHRPDARACRETLRAWAWSGAASHQISGVGAWVDDMPTEHARLGEVDREALDHVATPLRFPDVDTGKTMRRFVHRSIREHLVAEHVASLPVDQAVEALLPHIWYDADWEYSAPAALAMHPQRDQVLRDLIRRAARSAEIPADMSVIDAGCEFRRFLAQVAGESRETDWSRDTARIIGQARVELAWSSSADIPGVAFWWTSNRQARRALLRRLAKESDSKVASELADRVVRLDPTDQDKRQARCTLLQRLTNETVGSVIKVLADRLAQLDPTDQDKRQARDALLQLLTHETGSKMASDLADGLADCVAQLDPTDEDKRQARYELLQLLTHETARPVIKLQGWVTVPDPADQDKRQARETGSKMASDVADGLARLDPTDQDKRQARHALLQHLTKETGSKMASDLADGLARLDPTDQDKRQARHALLQRLTNETDSKMASDLADQVARLATTDQDKRQARDALLQLLTHETTDEIAAALIYWLAQLDPTDQDKHQALHALLQHLTKATDRLVTEMLVGCLARLDPTGQAKRQARHALLQLLTHETGSKMASDLATGLARLDPTGQAKRQARHALLQLLTHETGSKMASDLATGLARLDPTGQAKRQARHALLQHLTKETDGPATKMLALWLARFNPTDQDKRQARHALLQHLTQETFSPNAIQQADVMIQLDPTDEDKRQARYALLQCLAHEPDIQAGSLPVFGMLLGDDDPVPAMLPHVGVGVVKELVDRVARLDPTDQDKRQARHALLQLLARQTNGWIAIHQAEAAAQLDSTDQDKRQARHALLQLLAGV